MGGLFSSDNSSVNYENSSVFKSRQTSSSTTSYRSSAPSSSSRYDYYDYNPTFFKTPNITRNNIYNRDDLYSVDNLYVDRIRNNPSIDVSLPSEQITRCPMFKSYINSDVVSYTSVSSDSLDYHIIKRLVKNRLIKIDRIVQVNNEFLEKSYQLKKEEKIYRYGYQVKEHLLFHGTSVENALKICENNFDWRLCSRHRFGKGVNFSSSAKYASDSIKQKYNKVLIVAKVLIFKSHEGDPFTTLPRDGYDTTGKNDFDAIVQVKYEDAEFYPAYLIYYHMNIR